MVLAFVSTGSSNNELSAETWVKHNIGEEEDEREFLKRDLDTETQQNDN